MVVKDSILKTKLMYLTAEMSRFRNNISPGIAQDESLDEKPLNLLRLADGFKEAWRIWREGDIEDGRDARKENSFQAFLTIVSSE